jgi:hypothetical protein
MKLSKLRWQRCVLFGIGFGFICMVLSVLLKGLAEHSSVLAIVVWFVLLPSWFGVWVFGINDAFSYELFGLVFAFQSLFGAAACIAVHLFSAYLNQLLDESKVKADSLEKEHV